jgi:F0F1-type ATP synthase assembly protein I
MKNDSTELLGCVLGIGLVAILIPLGILIDGFVLTKLWEWIVLEIFENAPVLSIVHAIGLSLVAAFLTHKPTQTKDERDEKEKVVAALGELFLYPAWLLLFGYIISLLL